MKKKLSWAAGLFEGEGSLGWRMYRGRPSSPIAQLISTDEDVVRRFASVIGLGNVNGPYQYGEKKPYWQWSAIGFEKVQHVVASLWHELGVRRRERAREVMLAVRVDGRQFGRGGKPNA